MRQSFALTSTYSSDTFGVCSALYELGGMVVIHDASGCNSTYTTHDEPRWYDMDSMIYISALSQNETILGKDEKLIEDIRETAAKLHPKFIAIVGAPVPYMVGTDYKAIAYLLEKELHVPCFGFDTNGMRYYTRGVRDALKAVAKRLVPEPAAGCRREVRGGRAGEGGRTRVNILGATPLDMGMTGTVGSLKRWLNERGMECVSCFAMGDSLEDIARAGGADVSLVVSYGGLAAARVLEERFGIPYVCGLPFDGALMAKELGDAKTCSVIGEQIYSLSLARALADEGVTADVLCPLDRAKNRSLVDPSIRLIPVPEEDDVIREADKAEAVIADPLYRTVCTNTRLIELPHIGFSGRIFETEIPDMIGKGDWLEEKIKNA
ncbi:MAG: oxidoreductase [Lachnospiraceae bacterium]|nr:oxidoreductase [Lachnospiraceae bacterium]